MSQEPMSRFKKFILIMLVGVALVFAVNLVRSIAGDLDHFQVTKEGLNVAILLFAIGAGFIGSYTPNNDRQIFGRFVIYIGVICTGIVFFLYDMNYIVLACMAVQILVSSRIVAAIPVPYP